MGGVLLPDAQGVLRCTCREPGMAGKAGARGMGVALEVTDPAARSTRAQVTGSCWFPVARRTVVAFVIVGTPCSVGPSWARDGNEFCFKDVSKETREERGGELTSMRRSCQAERTVCRFSASSNKSATLVMIPPATSTCRSKMFQRVSTKSAPDISFPR